MDLHGKKILLTGGAGFLGAHVKKQLMARGVPEKNISVPRSRECDLRKWENCVRSVAGHDLVIHLAGNVGGIGYNRENPGSLFYDNIMMGVQLMEAARPANVAKFGALGT